MLTNLKALYFIYFMYNNLYNKHLENSLRTYPQKIASENSLRKVKKSKKH